MSEYDEKNKFSSVKQSHIFGLKTGFLFCILSILSGITMFFPLIIASILESIASVIPVNENIGKTSFFLALFPIIPVLVFYVKGLFQHSENVNTRLSLLFLSFLIFLPSVIFYLDWFSSNFRMDGQQGFGLIMIPVKISWIYPVFGFVHDIFREKSSEKKIDLA